MCSRERRFRETEPCRDIRTQKCTSSAFIVTFSAICELDDNVYRKTPRVFFLLTFCSTPSNLIFHFIMLFNCLSDESPDYIVNDLLLFIQSKYLGNSVSHKIGELSPVDVTIRKNTIGKR